MTKKKKKNKVLSFSSGMKPEIKQEERSRISPRPFSKTGKKLTRFRPPKMS